MQACVQLCALCKRYFCSTSENYAYLSRTKHNSKPRYLALTNPKLTLTNHKLTPTNPELSRNNPKEPELKNDS